jgi:hypothetical protein
VAIRPIPGARVRRHAIWRLAPDLLLVFKPRKHREASHAHEHAQRLYVVAGCLEVNLGGRARILRASSRPMRIPSGRIHTTIALEDTWLVARAEPRRATRANEG